MQEDAQNRRQRQLRLVERSGIVESQEPEEQAGAPSQAERPPLDLTDEFHFVTR